MTVKKTLSLAGYSVLISEHNENEYEIYKAMGRMAQPVHSDCTLRNSSSGSAQQMAELYFPFQLGDLCPRLLPRLIATTK